MSQNIYDNYLHVYDILMKSYVRVLSPRPSALRSFFRWTAITIISVLTVFVLVASSPLFFDRWGCYLQSNMLSGYNLKKVMHWCDWLAALLQIGIFACVGGIIFTDDITNLFRKITDRVHERIIDRATENSRIKSEYLTNKVVEIEKILESFKDQTRKRKITDVIRLYKIQFSMSGEALNVPSSLFWFAIRGLVLNFPGGLYGFLIFVLISAQIVAITTKITFDNLEVEVCSR